MSGRTCRVFVGITLFYSLIGLPGFPTWLMPVSSAQTSRSDPTSETTLVDAARQVIKASGYALLVTLDKTGAPRARVMGVSEPDSDLRVWMPTKKNTRKVEDIRGDSRSLLAYYDAKGGGYVTLAGRARISTELAEKRRHWIEQLRQFFPDGPEADDFVLIELAPSRIEVLSFSLGIATKPFDFKPAVLVRKGDQWAVER